MDTAAAAAAGAIAGLRDWMITDYLPRAADTPDSVGEERYRRSARMWTGANLDLGEVYELGWSQYQQLRQGIQAEARHVLPGSAPLEAMRYLDEFDLAEPLRVVEARIAPSGSAAAPYYTAPSQDFSRPGRTWLPTLGRTRFPEWNLISVWYHEGVPGHHLQLAQWVYLSQQLSVCREAARAARGAGFDLKAWHMAALSLGSLGLADRRSWLSSSPAGRRAAGPGFRR